MPSQSALQTGKRFDGVEAVPADDQALVAELAELLHQVAAVGGETGDDHQVRLGGQDVGRLGGEVGVGGLEGLDRDQLELGILLHGRLEDLRLRLAERVVLREEDRDALEIRVDVHRGLHGVRSDLGHGRRDARDVLADLRDALRRVGGADDRNPRLVGDRVGGEGLLGQRRPDDRHDLGDVDEVLEGVDRARLVPCRVLEDQLHRPAVHAALLVEELLGDLGADDLLLAEERHVARLRDGDPHRDRVGGVRAGRRAEAGAGDDSQGQDARENPLHVVPPTPVSMRGHARGCPGRGPPPPAHGERAARTAWPPAGACSVYHIVARHINGGRRSARSKLDSGTAQERNTCA